MKTEKDIELEQAFERLHKNLDGLTEQVEEYNQNNWRIFKWKL